MKYKYVQPWECGFGHTAFDSKANYCGPDLSEYYTLPVTTHRDADALQRVNFVVALERLERASSATGDVEAPERIRQGSWAVGWVEVILIDARDLGALAEAERIGEDLERYPILDETAFGEAEYEEASTCWEGMSIAERVQAIQKHGRVSVFAARRDTVPDGVQDYLHGN